MAKRRTRKQKEGTKHTFAVSWGDEDTPTNGKNKSKEKATNGRKQSKQISDNKDISIIKKSLLKSVIVFVVIMGALIIFSFLR